MKKQSFSECLLALKDHHSKIFPMDMRRAFQENSNRFSELSLEEDDLLVDWSKCCVDSKTMLLLANLAQSASLSDKRDSMFCGDPINTTENRSVLHTALRDFDEESLKLRNLQIGNKIKASLFQMEQFSDAIRSARFQGIGGKKIKAVVNIGIGGSDLGSAMAVEALKPFCDGPDIYHVSNVDGAHIHDTLEKLNPLTTFFLVCSKTFSTVETLINAETARSWMEAELGKEASKTHFGAVTARQDRAIEFGIDKKHVFSFEEWVGGRYSIWSAIGLPLMIALGKEKFRLFLEGAREMDRHFLNRPFLNNAPVVMALIGYWHRVLCHYPARAILPYDQRLSRLPAWLQQLDMESNGKRVKKNGEVCLNPTGPLVWGETGVQAQHAFFQFLHQGTDIIPVEFLVASQGHEPDLHDHHDLLLANCFAQSEALMYGRTQQEVRDLLSKTEISGKTLEKNIPHRVFPGGRPSLTLLYHKLTPRTLGRLLALFEHRVFVEGVLYDVNSFDQWGVELGKELAEKFLPLVKQENSFSSSLVESSSSTQGLVYHMHKLRKL